MRSTRQPCLYQINTRVVLHEIGQRLGRVATLDDFTDADLGAIIERGFDWVWFLGVWQTGDIGRAVSLSQPEWQAEYRSALSDFSPDDVCGSPFAICDYIVHRDFGGDDALRRLRERMAKVGLRLLLDFVPNHTAQDHRWVQEHPEYYVQGDDDIFGRDAHNYRRVETKAGSRILALGRDPYFPGWPDTFQLNYRHAGLREEMVQILQRLADMCDGVRCDMAMLLLPDVIARTWGELSRPADGTMPDDTPFWPCGIGRVRERRADFLFVAEVYWDLEWTLQQQGFDFTYDKRLYDRLVAGNIRGAHDHLKADPEFQARSTRFLENHDEPRAAAVFQPGKHQAAAISTFFLPGMRFFHEGQLEGRRLRASLHLRRRPAEPVDLALQRFYRDLLECLRLPEVHAGTWRLLECRSAWDGNGTWDHFLAYAWEGQTPGRVLVIANHGSTRGQCYVQLPFAGLGDRKFLLLDQLSPARYERDGAELANGGLYLDLPEWGYHVFEMMPL